VDDDSEEGYTGSVTLVVNDQEIAGEAELRGHFEPIDGRYHWYGRLAPNPAVDALLNGPVSVELRTPEGSAPASKVGDADPWGRLRISGVGRPPFRP
jgi:hypothetical protein